MEDGDVKGRSLPASSADGTRPDHARSVCWTGWSAAGVRRLAPPSYSGVPGMAPWTARTAPAAGGHRRRVLEMAPDRSGGERRAV